MSGKNVKYEPKDIIKDALFFVITVAASYGYILLMLMILSFMLVAVFPLQFEQMLILAGIGAAGVAVWYIVKMVKKYRK